MASRRERAAVQPAEARRRRARSVVPRTKKVTAWYSDEELVRVEAYAARARLAVAAYVAEASLRPSAWQVGEAPTGLIDEGRAPESPAAGPVMEDPPAAEEMRQLELLELMGVHRQLRGAATNLNQAVAKLNAIGEPVGELAAIAAYVRQVATAADAAVAAVRMRR